MRDFFNTENFKRSHRAHRDICRERKFAFRNIKSNISYLAHPEGDVKFCRERKFAFRNIKSNISYLAHPERDVKFCRERNFAFRNIKSNISYLAHPERDVTLYRKNDTTSTFSPSSPHTPQAVCEVRRGALVESLSIKVTHLRCV